MPDLERASTIVSSGVNGVRTNSRSTNLYLPPDNPFTPLDSRNKVIEVVKGYIDGQLAIGNIAWGNHLLSYLKKFKKLKLSVKLDSFLRATDYYSEEEQDGHEPTESENEMNTGTAQIDAAAAAKVHEIQTYADYFTYLETKVRTCVSTRISSAKLEQPNKHLRAQIMFGTLSFFLSQCNNLSWRHCHLFTDPYDSAFVHGNEVVSRLKQEDKWYLADRAALSMSFPPQERTSNVSSEKLFQVTSAMLCAILGAYWKIDCTNLARLFGMKCDLTKGDQKCRIRLPSCGASEQPYCTAIATLISSRSHSTRRANAGLFRSDVGFGKPDVLPKRLRSVCVEAS